MKDLVIFMCLELKQMSVDPILCALECYIWFYSLLFSLLFYVSVKIPFISHISFKKDLWQNGDFAS